MTYETQDTNCNNKYDWHRLKDFVHNALEITKKQYTNSENNAMTAFHMGELFAYSAMSREMAKYDD